MSLVAHRFGGVEFRGNFEYRIFVLILSSVPALRKQQQIFKIRHVQINELPRTSKRLLDRGHEPCAHQKNSVMHHFFNYVSCSPHVFTNNEFQNFWFVLIRGDFSLQGRRKQFISGWAPSKYLS